MRYESERERRFWRPYRIIKTIALIMTGVALISVFAAVYTTRNGMAGTGETQKQPAIADGQMSRSDADEEIERRANEALDEGVIIDCRTEIYANAGQTLIQNIDLINNAENTESYMTYELRLPDSSGQSYEVLFSTGMIAPGNTILDVELSRPLEAGEYACILVAQPYEISDLSPDNSLEMSLNLKVQ